MKNTNIIEIKGIVPGAGKTTLLTHFFIKSNLKNKIILTPSNKARQVCISKLIEFGMDPQKAETLVFTMRKFKQNFYTNYTVSKYTDIETGEVIEEKENLRYISKKSIKHYGKVWNIFIDEASMFSDCEMKDLSDNWKIQNLVLDGDSLQFDPIGKSDILEGENNSKVSEWVDEGKPYNLEVNHQILLNESMRSRDEKLTDAIKLIKEGKIIDALCEYLLNAKNCNNLQSDIHIAYTNNRCSHLNQMYPNVKRYIVTHNDNVHGFYTSETLEEDCERLKDLKDRLFYERLLNKKVPTFEEWKASYLKPAYALTCHKLQGTTINEGDIFIHMDDLLCSMDCHIDDIDEKAKLLQKFLYVAVSRAVSLNQINIFGSMGISKKGNKYAFTLAEEMDGNEEYCDKLVNILHHVKPMVDDSIKESAMEFSAKDPKALEYLMSVVNYDENIELEGEKEWKEMVSKAHSKQHKQHKQKITDEFLELAKTLREKEWVEKTGLSKSSYQKARRMLKNLDLEG